MGGGLRKQLLHIYIWNFSVRRRINAFDIMYWEKTATEKRGRIAAAIPKEWRVDVSGAGDSVMDFPAKSGLLSTRELEITNSSATDLVAKMAAGDLSSVDVTTAFCKRAALAQQLVGWLETSPV